MVADQDARGDRARRRIELPADGLDLAVEDLARVGVEADLGARADLHAREVLLEQAAEEVDVLEIADDGDDVLGVDASGPGRRRG